MLDKYYLENATGYHPGSVTAPRADGAPDNNFAARQLVTWGDADAPGLKSSVKRLSVAKLICDQVLKLQAANSAALGCSRLSTTLCGIKVNKALRNSVKVGLSILLDRGESPSFPISMAPIRSFFRLNFGSTPALFQQKCILDKRRKLSLTKKI